MSRVNVIDLFAGPGGLGEGFSTYTSALLGGKKKDRIFKIRLSIEMDEHAHETLMLRSFLRQFSGDYPQEYYDYYRSEISLEQLRELPELAREWEAARAEVGHRPLKMGDEEDDRAIEAAIAAVQADAGKQDKWVVIGGPPCQAFSTVGRVRNMSKPDYHQTKDERIYAYIEYLKILDQVRPDCFILENVEGMLQTAPDGEPIFPTIQAQLQQPALTLRELGKKIKDQGENEVEEAPAYRIVAATDGSSTKGATKGIEYLVPIVDYGVPQDRRRVILIGIREDLVDGLSDERLPKLKRFTDAVGTSRSVSVGEVIGDLPKVRSKISFRNFFGSVSKGESDRQSVKEERQLSAIDCYVNGVLAIESGNIGAFKTASKSSLTGELRVPFVNQISVKTPAEKSIRAQYPLSRNELKILRESKQVPVDSKDLWLKLFRKNLSLVSKWGKGNVAVQMILDQAKSVDVGDGSFLEISNSFSGPSHLKEWLLDPFLGGVRNHESRKHKGSDLLRYLYFATNSQTELGATSNISLRDIPNILQPDHANVQSGHFSDRFRVQQKDKPAKTITCHLSKDGHAFIHYDPVQCRALTVREAARIQTFPDNYVFCGPVSQQRKQVGNAVPPWFSVQLAGLIDELLNLKGPTKVN